MGEVSLVENGQTNHGLHFVIPGPSQKKIPTFFCSQHCTPKPSMFFFFEQSLKSRVVWVFVAGCTYHPSVNNTDYLSFTIGIPIHQPWSMTPACCKLFFCWSETWIQCQLFLSCDAAMVFGTILLNWALIYVVFCSVFFLQNFKGTWGNTPGPHHALQ